MFPDFFERLEKVRNAWIESEKKIFNDEKKL